MYHPPYSLQIAVTFISAPTSSNGRRLLRLRASCDMSRGAHGRTGSGQVSPTAMRYIFVQDSTRLLFCAAPGAGRREMLKALLKATPWGQTVKDKEMKISSRKVCFTIISAWPSDVIWLHNCGLIWARKMASCLMDRLKSSSHIWCQLQSDSCQVFTPFMHV